MVGGERGPLACKGDLSTPFQGSLVPPYRELSNHECMAVGEA